MEKKVGGKIFWKMLALKLAERKYFARNWLKENIFQVVEWKKLFCKKLAERNYFGSSGLEENILHEVGLKK